jgi:trimeric autotransporter adhesin
MYRVTIFCLATVLCLVSMISAQEKANTPNTCPTGICFIQNTNGQGTYQQPSASFNIDGTGDANVINSGTNYRIGGSRVMSIGSADDQNLFLGVGAGTNNVAGKGFYNVFSGHRAGYSNTTGVRNVFSGDEAGDSNTEGVNNVFNGYRAGYSNTTGGFNVFAGVAAGYSNTDGYYNVFSGFAAGTSNTIGVKNVFSGFGAGFSNTTGSENVFSGYEAGYSNTTGSRNVFSGENAGYIHATGDYNVFSGFGAGENNTSGSGNTYIGAYAGNNHKSGNNNLYLGNSGCDFPCTESSTIRIGGDGGLGYGPQTKAFIAGIYGSTSSGGIPVYINSNGRLGTTTSSLRFKEQVRNMGDSTSSLMKLRPVTFLYKPEYQDGERMLQYGLIAEEVAQVYPELVAYDKDSKPYTVRYQFLAPMLLNELQKQHTVVSAQQDVITTQQKEIDDLRQRLARLEALVGRQLAAAH